MLSPLSYVNLIVFVLQILEDEIIFVLDFHSLMCCGSDVFFVPLSITIRSEQIQL